MSITTSFRSWAAIALPLAIVGCAKSGVGTGVMEGGAATGQQAEFYWKSGASALHGDITTVLPDGRRFSGQFLEITSTSTVPDVAPFYDDWNDGWGPGWDSAWWTGDYGPGAYRYITNYSGKALANLRGAGGETMRCYFELNAPQEGLAGGGQGQCRISDGTRIESAILQPAGET